MPFESLGQGDSKSGFFAEIPQGTHAMSFKEKLSKKIKQYTECKYGGSLGQPGSSCAKARLVRPREFCFDCTS